MITREPMTGIELEMIEVLWLLGHTPAEITKAIPFGRSYKVVWKYINEVFKPMARMPGYTKPPREDLLKRKARLFGTDPLTGLPGAPSV